MNIASVGTINEAISTPREVLKSSILSNAASIVLIHNHPSNNILPSKIDTMMTDRMKKACDIIGIPLADHIIIGTRPDAYFSFMEKDLMPIKKLDLETDYMKMNIENRENVKLI